MLVPIHQVLRFILWQHDYLLLGSHDNLAMAFWARSLKLCVDHGALNKLRACMKLHVAAVAALKRNAELIFTDSWPS